MPAHSGGYVALRQLLMCEGVDADTVVNIPATKRNKSRSGPHNSFGLAIPLKFHKNYNPSDLHQLQRRKRLCCPIKFLLVDHEPSAYTGMIYATFLKSG